MSAAIIGRVTAYCVKWAQRALLNWAQRAQRPILNGRGERSELKWAQRAVDHIDGLSERSELFYNSPRPPAYGKMTDSP